LKTKVRYFALFREQAGLDSEFVDWQGGSTADLFQVVSGMHAGISGNGASLVAINDEMCSWETIVTEGDEVLFFPPVAGG
jgi:molybdopterin converting factor small subunit